MVWINIVINVLLFFFVVICLLMSTVVLMQRGKQDGIGAAFGGSFTDQFLGAQTSQVLVKFTVWLAILFFVLSISLARLYAMRAHDTLVKSKTSVLQDTLLKPVPAAPNLKPNASTNAVPNPVPVISTNTVTLPSVPTPPTLPAAVPAPSVSTAVTNTVASPALAKPTSPK